MLLPRIIPCLLLRRAALVKTVKFDRPGYVGDPVNAVHIFNEKEVDELIFLDITATSDGRSPSLATIETIASECFMPVTYGGGIRSVDDMARIFSVGIEKVSVNTALLEEPTLIRRAADRFGSQSVVASIDVRQTRKGYRVVGQGGSKVTDWEPVALAVRAQELGAGEILLTSADRDGTMEGYDLTVTRVVSQAVDVPLVACGGAGTLDDLRSALKVGGASAAAAGSMFVYHGRHRAVLINFPTPAEASTVVA